MTIRITIIGLALLFAWNACDRAEDPVPDTAPPGPYTSNIETYPADWEPRTFHCKTVGNQFDWIPGFTMEVYSDPSESEFEELCACIDENTEMPWVKDTGRKLNNREKVTDIFFKRAFPARVGEKINTCTKDK